VPAKHSKVLFDAAKVSHFRQLYVIEGGRHNDSWLKGGELYRDKLNKFMQESKQIMTKIREFNVKMEDFTL
jgi:hypothetical protein